MGDKRKLEFCLLRYVPDAVKGEFVNIGIVAVEQDGGFSEVRLTRDWGRVRCLDPEVEVEVLAALEAEIRRDLAGDQRSFIKKIEDSFSGVVQLSSWEGCLTEDPVQEMKTLERMYLEGMQFARKREVGPRQRIYAAMETAFEAAGVLGLMKQGVNMAPYTWAMDTAKIDFLYEHRKEVKMFQAVSVSATPHAAIELAYRYVKVAKGMYEQDGNQALMTAVIEANMSREVSQVGAALEAMEQSGMAVLSVDEMPAVAERVRQELRA